MKTMLCFGYFHIFNPWKLSNIEYPFHSAEIMQNDFNISQYIGQYLITIITFIYVFLQQMIQLLVRAETSCRIYTESLQSLVASE